MLTLNVPVTVPPPSVRPGCNLALYLKRNPDYIVYAETWARVRPPSRERESERASERSSLSLMRWEAEQRRPDSDGRLDLEPRHKPRATPAASTGDDDDVDDGTDDDDCVSRPLQRRAKRTGTDSAQPRAALEGAPATAVGAEDVANARAKETEAEEARELETVECDQPEMSQEPCGMPRPRDIKLEAQGRVLDGSSVKATTGVRDCKRGRLAWAEEGPPQHTSAKKQRQASKPVGRVMPWTAHIFSPVGLGGFDIRIEFCDWIHTPSYL